MKKQSFIDSIFNFFGYDRDDSPIPNARHAPSGILIQFNIHENIFPRDWRNERTNPQVMKIRRGEMLRSAEVIGKAMDKYPIDFLKRNLATVQVVRRMSFFNLRYGGTHSNDKIYIANDGVWKGYTNSNLENTFHHEMASILLHHYSKYINKEKWTQLNQRAYTGDGANAIADWQVDKTFYHKLHKQGFLHAFSSSGFRNDFVSFAENIFMGNNNFYRAVEKFPIIKKKYKMMISFYYMVDEQFTPEYFRKIVR